MSIDRYQEWHFHVHDTALGKNPYSVSDPGWLVIANAGLPTSPTVYKNKYGTALTAIEGIAIMAMSSGQARFYTEKTVTSLDLCWVTNDGLAGYRRAQAADVSRQLQVNSTNGVTQRLMMPFGIVNDANEIDTGIELPADCLVTESAVRVTTVDATETLDFGLLSSESGGDADGFLDGAALGVAGHIVATQGAVMQTITDGVAKTLSYEVTTGTDTAAGYLSLGWRRLLG